MVIFLADIPTTVNTCMTVTPTTQTAPVGLAVHVDKLVGDVDIPPEAEYVLCVLSHVSSYHIELILVGLLCFLWA